MHDNINLSMALKYRELGWSIIPIAPNSKKPLVPWKPYQQQKASVQQIKDWWAQYPDAGMAVILGKISGVFVVDIDDDQGITTLQNNGINLMDEPTVVQQSGRGFHYFYQYPDTGQKTINFNGGEIRSDGSYVILYPSVHTSGKQYTWKISPFLQHPVCAPRNLLDFKDHSNGSIVTNPQKDSQLIFQGNRNNALTSLAGTMRRRNMTEQEIYNSIKMVNRDRCQPPLPDAELRSIAKSVARYQPDTKTAITTDILPDDQSADMAFPDIMSGAAGDFAKVYSDYLEPPKRFFYISYLCCLGSILSGKVTLASELSPQPRLYVLILGESADDRKSTTLNKTVDFFRNNFPAFQVNWGVGSAEGLQKELEKSSSLLLCLDEFKQFIEKSRIKASVLLPCVNTLFESNNYSSSTKTLPVRVENVHLGVLAASTIQTYERTWDASFTDIGFNNRLFIVPGSGERKFPFPPRIPLKETNLLKKQLTDILTMTGDNLELTIAPDAKKRYDTWYMNREMSVHAKRLDTYAMRFMILLAVNEMQTIIDKQIIEKVIALMDWQLRVRQILDPIDADNALAKMEEKIRRLLHRGPKTERVLRQYSHANRAGLLIYDNAKNNLQKHKEIMYDRKNKIWQIKNV